MSDDDQSGDNRSFLARWSQRKREAKQPDRDAPAADGDVPAHPVAEADAGPEFDLSSLPKLEDMTATTDITAFLRKGVPESLRNAALRKSWTLDPAVRNYVNPALEYAYDWNSPGGVPGSSEIGAGMDVARLVSQIMGSGEATVASDPAQFPEPNVTPESKPDWSTQTLQLGNETISTTQKPLNTREGERIEVEQAEDSEENNSAAPQQVVRRHGSAKPLV
jgi:uncharacterized protein DUF3306